MAQGLLVPSKLEVTASNLEKSRRFAPAERLRLVQLERPRIVPEGGLDLAHVEVELADRVRDRGLGRRIAQRLQERARLLEVLERFLVLSYAGIKLTQHPGRLRFAPAVPLLSRERLRPP